MNSVKETDVKNRMYYFLDDMIITKNFDLNKIKKLIHYILIYYISHAIANSLKYLYLIINEINGYFEESDRRKYLKLVPSDERKDTLKRMKNHGTKPKILLDQ